jgi:hypothetical protein
MSTLEKEELRLPCEAGTVEYCREIATRCRQCSWTLR